ncbi:MAG TPA: carboxypeptidase M32, partial [Chloroflexota bacterium]
MAVIAELVDELRTVGAELVDLGRVARLLSWDQETMMPRRGAPWRARQRATLQGLYHERLTRPRVGELLDALEEPSGQGELRPEDAALVRELRREYDRATKVPTSFVREMAQATAEGVEVWRQAREASRFADFAPALERILELKRRESEYVGYADHPYDAHLDKYEPDTTVSQLSPLFAELRRATVDLLARLQGAPRQADRSVLEREYDEGKQWAFGEDLLRAIGFDFTAGRIDRSTHPFSTSMGPGDARITTRMASTDLAMAMFGTLHEGGHALYEQG